MISRRPFFAAPGALYGVVRCLFTGARMIERPGCPDPDPEC